jgi:hypothetical protein
MGDVDRDAHRRQALCAQLRNHAHGRLHRPPAHLQDQARLLQQRDELHRRHQPDPRIVPADQRLEAHDTARGEFDLGLVMQDELVTLERAAKPALHGKQFRDLGIEVGGVEDDLLALSLRALQRRLGILKQRVRIRAIGGKQRDPGTSSELQYLAVNAKASASTDSAGWRTPEAPAAGATML